MSDEETIVTPEVTEEAEAEVEVEETPAEVKEEEVAA